MAPPKKSNRTSILAPGVGEQGGLEELPRAPNFASTGCGGGGRWLGREQALWGWGEVGWERSEGGRGLPARPGEGSGRRGGRGMLS